MYDVQAHFGNLRSLLQNPPSELLWGKVCEALEGVDARLFEEELVPYIQGHLSHWGDAPRTAPQHWLDRALRDQSAPQLALCTRLWRRKGTTTAELRALGNMPELSQIHTIDLVSCDLNASLIEALVRPDCFASLARLDVSFNLCGDEGAALLAHAPKSIQLTHLRMDQCHITDHGAQEIARSPYMKNLDTLTLYNNALTDWGIEELRRSPHLSENARRPWLFVNEA